MWGSGFRALAYLLALGYMASLLTADTPSVAMIIALAVLGIAGFAILLFGGAVSFRGMHALDSQYGRDLSSRRTLSSIDLANSMAFVYSPTSFRPSDSRPPYCPSWNDGGSTPETPTPSSS